MTYCLDCQTALPEGARFCHNCGKAVGGIEQGRKRIGHGQLVPVMKEEPASDREYVRIRDVVSVSDDAAALVVYCHASQQGQTVRVGIDPSSYMLSRQHVALKGGFLHASVVARQAGGKKFCAAIFPRIYFFTQQLEKGSITQALCVIKWLEVYFRGDIVEARRQTITLYPGVITEVDWSMFERSEHDLSG